MTNIDLLPGEEILLRAHCGIGTGWIYGRGKLVLTNQRLLLRPDALNLYTDKRDVLLSDVADVQPFNVQFLLPWGVKIGLKDGRVQKVRLLQRNELVSALRRLAGLEQSGRAQ